MAITLVQKLAASTIASGTTHPITVSSTGAGNLLVVVTQLVDPYNVTGVSDGTTAFTQATNAQTGTPDNRKLDCWYLLSSNSGKTTITVTRDGAADAESKIAWFFEFAGFTTAAFDVADVLDGQTMSGTTLVGASVNTGAASGVVVGVGSQTSGSLSSMLGGNEFTFGDTSAYGSGSAYLISASAAAHRPDWVGSVGGSSYGAVTAAFKETAAGGGTVALSGSAATSGSGTSVPNFQIPL